MSRVAELGSFAPFRLTLKTNALALTIFNKTRCFLSIFKAKPSQSEPAPSLHFHYTSAGKVAGNYHHVIKVLRGFY